MTSLLRLFSSSPAPRPHDPPPYREIYDLPATGPDFNNGEKPVIFMTDSDLQQSISASGQDGISVLVGIWESSTLPLHNTVVLAYAVDFREKYEFRTNSIELFVTPEDQLILSITRLRNGVRPQYRCSRRNFLTSDLRFPDVYELAQQIMKTRNTRSYDLLGNNCRDFSADLFEELQAHIQNKKRLNSSDRARFYRLFREHQPDYTVPSNQGQYLDIAALLENSPMTATSSNEPEIILSSSVLPEEISNYLDKIVTEPRSLHDLQPGEPFVVGSSHHDQIFGLYLGSPQKLAQKLEKHLKPLRIESGILCDSYDLLIQNLRECTVQHLCLAALGGVNLERIAIHDVLQIHPDPNASFNRVTAFSPFIPLPPLSFVSLLTQHRISRLIGRVLNPSERPYISIIALVFRIKYPHFFPQIDQQDHLIQPQSTSSSSVIFDSTLYPSHLFFES